MIFDDDDILINPPPVMYGALYVTDADKAFGMDCTANLTARGNDSIVSIGTPTVLRADGAPITSADPVISNVVVSGGGLQFSWTITGNGNSSRYYAIFPLNLTKTGTINRAIMFSLKPLVG